MLKFSPKCLQKYVVRILKQSFSTHLANDTHPIPGYIEFIGTWVAEEKEKFLNDMVVQEGFLTDSEEQALFEEVEPYMKRLRYEFDHWDDAIHGYRETERKHWYPHNKAVISKINKIAFNDAIMPYIHVLDLAADGVIKPHVDSSRYCGSTIAGLSLLSDCVMRLVRTDETKYKQDTDDYRNTSNNSSSTAGASESTPTFSANILLRKRSLYIMRDSARYNFTHEILGNGNALFKQHTVLKDRRISIICRNKP